MEASAIRRAQLPAKRIDIGAWIRMTTYRLLPAARRYYLHDGMPRTIADVSTPSCASICLQNALSRLGLAGEAELASHAVLQFVRDVRGGVAPTQQLSAEELAALADRKSAARGTERVVVRSPGGNHTVSIDGCLLYAKNVGLDFCACREPAELRDALRSGAVLFVVDGDSHAALAYRLRDGRTVIDEADHTAPVPVRDDELMRSLTQPGREVFLLRRKVTPRVNGS